MSMLLVEDNLVNQTISKIMLEQIGCHVDIASYAKDAIEKMNTTFCFMADIRLMFYIWKLIPYWWM